MPTSGSVDFSVSRDNLIEDALRVAGILGVEDSASNGQKTWASRQLNMMVKSWHGIVGISLWARKVGYILPQMDVNEIELGPTGDHATLSYTQTTVSTASDSGDLTIAVASATGIVAGYNIGIELDDGSVQWSTIDSVVDTTVTIDDTLDDDVSVGAYVWVYQTKLQRPIRIVEAYVRNEVNNTESELMVVPKSEYERFSAKETDGIPHTLAYEPLLTDGKVYIYPRIGDAQTLIKIVFQRPFEDFDATADTPDFPQEWYLALMLNLAVLCAPAGGLPVADRKELKTEAAAAFAFAQMNDMEEGSFLIQPND